MTTIANQRNISKTAATTMEKRTGHLTEADFLLGCCRAYFDAEKANGLPSTVKEELDWSLLLVLAERHGLGPLVHLTLENRASDLIPPVVIKQSGQFLQNNTKICLHLTGRLLRVLELFEANVIDAVALKGPTLAAAAYGSIALRQFSDIDILIRPQDLIRVEGVLGSIGYTPKDSLAGAQYEALKRFNCELAFTRNDGDSTLDIHWRLVPGQFNFPVSTEEIWARRRSVALSGISVPVLSPEDNVLFLCVHGAKHQWERLEWVCSLGMLIKESEIDWQAVLERARASRSESRLALALVLIEKVLGLKPPVEIGLNAPRKRSVASAADEIMRRLAQEQRSEVSQLEIFRFNLKVMDNRVDALLCLLRSAFVPTQPDIAAIRLPQSLIQAYYVIRIFRLAGKYALKILTSLSPKSAAQEFWLKRRGSRAGV